MAMDRTNMVSLLDIGSLNNGASANIVELGAGFTEISEDWSPNTESTQYVNMKNAANTVKGYEFSFDAEREYLSDEVQTTLDTLFKSFPTGSACETYYYRFLKTDAVAGSEGVYNAIKVPVTVAPSSIGGTGGDTLTSAVQVNGNGDAVQGTITVSSTGYTWTPASGVSD